MTQWVFKTVWLYGIVEPVSGEYVLWEFSHLDSVCNDAFLDYFSQQYPNEMHIITFYFRFLFLLDVRVFLLLELLVRLEQIRLNLQVYI